MRVLVTGATGFTGSYVVPGLLARGVEVFCFTRPESDLRWLPRSGVSVLQGRLEEPATLAAALRGMDALVNVASLGFGHAAGIVEAVRQSRVRRAVFISTTAVFTALNAPSKAVRLGAEKCVQDSGLDYTILRPTMIYGSSRDRNMCRLIHYLRRWPVIPLFGSGDHLQHPVFVDDLAQAVTAALLEPITVARCYNISGANSLSYKKVIQTICSLLNRRVHQVQLPVRLVLGFLRTCERLKLKLPIKAEQVERLNEDKAFDHSDAVRDFGYRPRCFEEGIRAELLEMKLLTNIAAISEPQ